MLAPSLTSIASGRSLITSRNTRSALWKSIGLEFLPSLVAILAMLASFFSRIASVHAAGGGAQSLPMPSSNADTQEPISPTSGAAISTLLSISRGSMSIWMNRLEPGGPHCLPLPWLSSQFSRAPTSTTTSLSLSTVDRAAPAESGCVSGSSPLAMLIGMYGMPLVSTNARTASSACA